MPNLFISDGSVQTTAGAANPTLTIVALALRQADHIGREVRESGICSRASRRQRSLYTPDWDNCIHFT